MGKVCRLRLSDTTKTDDKIDLILKGLKDNWHVLDTTGEFTYNGTLWKVLIKSEYRHEDMTYRLLILEGGYGLDFLYYNVSIEKDMELVLMSGVYPAPISMIMTKVLEKDVRKIISYYEKHKINLTIFVKTEAKELNRRVRLFGLRKARKRLTTRLSRGGASIAAEQYYEN